MYLILTKGAEFEWCKIHYQGLIRPDLVFYIDRKSEYIIESLESELDFKRVSIHSKERIDNDFIIKAKEYFKNFQNNYYWRTIYVNNNEINVKNLTSDINELKAQMRRDFYQYGIGEDLFMYDNN